MTIRNSASSVISDTNAVWSKFMIPTIRPQHSIQKLEKFYTDYLLIKKHRNREKNSKTQQKNLEKFCQKLGKLFDIANSTAVKNLPNELKEFLVECRNGKVNLHTPVDSSLPQTSLQDKSDMEQAITNEDNKNNMNDIEYPRYKVISSDNEYYVNTVIEMCTCFIGKVGAPCKHQYAVAKQFNLTSQQFLPISDPREKILLAKLIKCNLPDSWFKSLTDLDIGLLGDCTENGNVDKDHNENIDNTVILEKRKESSLPEKENDIDQELLKQTEVKGVNTDSAMISALHTFGKYSGLPVIKKNCQGSRKIGVQPTAIARRKVPLGGRNVAVSGRPPKKHE
ncbi:unnamed protein product [Psylliodes chrysocephalus]|uniref:SWIM-type domain-containing protein n=1 Tax=Psylliodes chrysocephalus TaxID=3402493 RepID=A0A9P0GDY0_9CUCU|nr:unnamed protein product [Psylliodes chrysocephala]